MSKMIWNKKLMLGIVFCIIGPIIMETNFTHQREVKNLRPPQLLGFAVLALGAFLVYQGKKQQINDRKDSEV